MLGDVGSGGWRGYGSAGEGGGESFTPRVLFVMRPTLAAVASVFHAHHADEAKHGEDTCR